MNASGNETLHLQALTTNPDSMNGGVSVNSWGNTGWMNPTNPTTFAAIVGYSALAANQAGRVYGIVEGNAGPEIVEWAFDDSGAYTEVGNVATNFL